MNVALLAKAASPHTRKIANFLASTGNKVFLYSLPDHEDTNRLLDPAISVRYFNRGGTLSYFYNHWQLRTFLRDDDIDVLNAHYATGYGTMAALTRFHPYSLSVWGSDIFLFPTTGAKRALLRHNLSTADSIFSTSKSMADEVLKYAPGREVLVTPFGVDINLFSPGEPKFSGDTTIRVGIVKRLESHYGINYLIDAFATAQKHVSTGEMELHIYGDGTIRSDLEAQAERVGIDEFTTFHGAISHAQVPSALRGLDIFCVPSLSESFGVAAIEAMATGLPCVTSDATGLAEVMVDELTGIVVPKRNTQALSDALCRMASDKDLRLRMGAAGRAHVLETYDWRDNSENFLRALQTLLP